MAYAMTANRRNALDITVDAVLRVVQDTKARDRRVALLSGAGTSAAFFVFRRAGRPAPSGLVANAYRSLPWTTQLVLWWTEVEGLPAEDLPRHPGRTYPQPEQARRAMARALVAGGIVDMAKALRKLAPRPPQGFEDEVVARVERSLAALAKNES